MNPLLLFAIIFWTINAGLSQLLNTVHIHKTNAAAEKINDLWCYSCDSTEGDECLTPTENRSSLIKKCKPDEFVCMVKRFSFTTSNENTTSNPKIWALERKCTSTCDPGCIVIGERTKLFACTVCCETTFCNVGKGGAGTNFQSVFLKILLIVSFFGLLCKNESNF